MTKLLPAFFRALLNSGPVKISVGFPEGLCAFSTGFVLTYFAFAFALALVSGFLLA
jgi:hypothetical protein